MGLLLIGGAFDPERAVGVCCGLLLGVEAFVDVLARAIFADPGVEVLDIDDDGLAESRDFGLLHGSDGLQEVREDAVVKDLLFAAEMPRTRNGVSDMKAVRL